jgi:hypothetical protein
VYYYEGNEKGEKTAEKPSPRRRVNMKKKKKKKT